METMKPLDEIFGKVKKIATLPVVAAKLMSTVENPRHSGRDVVNLIKNDAALTARILRTANSSAFSRGLKISTIDRAIMHLGENMIVGIAIGTCASSIMNRPLKGYASEAGELWDHSLRTAIASKLLCSFVRSDIRVEHAFTAGLLHDIGKLIMSELLEGAISKIISYTVSRPETDYLDAERKMIGADHTQVGSKLAERWLLPPPIPDTICYHHRPSEYKGPHKELVFIVHLGDIIAMMGGSGTGADSLSYKMDPGYENFISIQKSEFASLLLTIEDDFESTKQSLFNSSGV
ncbi:MAG: HDOD domain-containing protein [FCB group bacterium]|nr:HDOD domain-containing protein [FCB group bacterium]